MLQGQSITRTLQSNQSDMLLVSSTHGKRKSDLMYTQSELEPIEEDLPTFKLQDMAHESYAESS